MMNYQGIAERDVYDILADVERRFPIDPDRVYLTGISMGGAGALRLALTRPDVWAAVAAVCPAPLTGVDDLAPNAARMCRSGSSTASRTPSCRWRTSRIWQRRLVDAGVAAEYIEYPGVRHNAWDLAYRGGAVFEWFDKLRRNRFPERVRLVAESYRDASAYWVAHRRPDARARPPVSTRGAPAAAEVAVETRNVDGFTLTLDRPAAAGDIDGAALRVRPSATRCRLLESGRQMARPAVSSRRASAPASEGPIAEAVSGRQIYVYGTAGARDRRELEARKRVAETAAAWSQRSRRAPRARLRRSRPTRPSRRKISTPPTWCSSGPRETNALIARFAPQLPLALNAGAADYGLLFIAPAGKHYALVSSGLPWWTGADDARRGGSARCARPVPPAEHLRRLHPV